MPEQVLKPPREAAATQAPAAASSPDKPRVQAHRFVDMWGMPGLHPTNVDILRKLRMAEDRQFGANMDTCGAIAERDAKTNAWEKTHLVGIRTDIWKPSDKERRRALNSLKKRRREQVRREIKNNGRLNKDEQQRLEAQLAEDSTMNLDAGGVDKRRLVLKLFRSTGKNIRWAGTLEEMTGREIHNSLGCRKPLLSLTANLAGYNYITNIDQNHRTGRIPAIFSFGYYDDRANRMWYVQIRRRLFSLGMDFAVEAEGKRIAYIDGKLIGFGRDSHVRVYEPALAADRRFLDLLTLFAASVGYHRAMRRHVKRRVKALRHRRLCHVMDDEELTLLVNPRRR